MLIRTECALDCSPDAAWDALHRPEVAAQLYAPALQMRPSEAFPARFTTGDRRTVELRLFGHWRLGTQLIEIEDRVPADPDASEGADPIADDLDASARAMRDRGRPLSGPLAALARWQHRITILPAPGSRAVWRDELSVGGAAAALFGPVLWAMWRIRRWKIRRLARSWDAALRERSPGSGDPGDQPAQ
ncbi:hypothetical protein MUN76_09995 [Leucobacter rhizosphaerae]|uniref:SRPBCC family protein n=1 Tax=Leucobacter rhizosphaerae TaxID=2932245 RepID=A0ABY4FT02_9MICO|nr:hypothetical protein [Leucobacter rhizosphaerae]UOQ59386.1 hypothetical protein MUN76_09995 [Leucobacter rhizosphaerae]